MHADTLIARRRLKRQGVISACHTALQIGEELCRVMALRKATRASQDHRSRGLVHRANGSGPVLGRHGDLR